MGDAVLAIFPTRDGGDDARTAAERALAAARDAERRLSRTNGRLAEMGTKDPSGSASACMWGMSCTATSECRSISISP